jgi:hypothetical protein
MTRRKARGAHAPTRRVRPGLLVVCVLALVATAGIRVASGEDEGTGTGIDAVEVAPVATTAPRPEGVAPDPPERNPFGTPGGPATSAEGPGVEGPGAETDETVDAEEAVARIAPGG